MTDNAMNPKPPKKPGMTGIVGLQQFTGQRVEMWAEGQHVETAQVIGWARIATESDSEVSRSVDLLLYSANGGGVLTGEEWKSYWRLDGDDSIEIKFPPNGADYD